MAGCCDCKKFNCYDDGDGRTDMWCDFMLDGEFNNGEKMSILDGCEHFEPED